MQHVLTVLLQDALRDLVVGVRVRVVAAVHFGRPRLVGRRALPVCDQERWRRAAVRPAALRWCGRWSALDSAECSVVRSVPVGIPKSRKVVDLLRARRAPCGCVWPCASLRRPPCPKCPLPASRPSKWSMPPARHPTRAAPSRAAARCPDMHVSAGEDPTRHTLSDAPRTFAPTADRIDWRALSPRRLQARIVQRDAVPPSGAAGVPQRRSG